MTTRLLALIRKEFIQTFRDIPIVALVIYSFAEILLCGWAVNGSQAFPQWCWTATTHLPAAPHRTISAEQ
jgi:hypothetical protein